MVDVIIQLTLKVKTDEEAKKLVNELIDTCPNYIYDMIEGWSWAL